MINWGYLDILGASRIIEKGRKNCLDTFNHFNIKWKGSSTSQVTFPNLSHSLTDLLGIIFFFIFITTNIPMILKNLIPFYTCVARAFVWHPSIKILTCVSEWLEIWESVPWSMVNILFKILIWNSIQSLLMLFCFRSIDFVEIFQHKYLNVNLVYVISAPFL